MKAATVSVCLAAVAADAFNAFIVTPPTNPTTSAISPRKCGHFPPGCLRLSCELNLQRQREVTPTTKLGASRGDDNLRDIRFEQKQAKESAIITFLPIITSFLSFLCYPATASIFHNVAAALSGNTWIPVDGGKLQAEVILPALNGVVMTAISLLYANLISTTGVTLKNRQLSIHCSLNEEAEEIRGLISLIDFYPTGVRQMFRGYLKQYVNQVVEEINPAVNPSTLRSKSPPVILFKSGLHNLSTQSDTTEINGMILSQSYNAIQRISSIRAARITSLQSTFPPLHYVTISALTLAMILVFLIETDQDVILFLNNFQLRLIWSIFIGTFTAIYCVGYDLSNPFVGTYQIPEILDDSDVILTLFDDDSVKRQKDK